MSGGPSAFCDGVTCVVADFDDVEEMNADGPARKGRSAVVCLAVTIIWSVCGGKPRLGYGNVPRRANEAADLVDESIVMRLRDECRRIEGHCGDR